MTARKRSSHRDEFCAQRQAQYEAFATRYVTKRGLKGIPAMVAEYPEEELAEAKPKMPGWRVSFYGFSGRVLRAFPFYAPIGADGYKVTPVLDAWKLTREFEATCDHECWPRPHPVCKCGIWASANATDTAAILESILAHPDRWAEWKLWKATSLGLDRWVEEKTHGKVDSRYIAYPVQMREVRQVHIPQNHGRMEYIAARVKITGPILTCNDAVRRDLKAHGFKVEQVGDTIEDLTRHLRALDKAHKPAAKKRAQR